ncbi:hypothetical protein D6745_00640 [Candidatus Woesearchaeota archaeon]|nr:MAG: hypothetical protein D6745_00640 [Candidatus Woesearchaeota archaeon]
MKLHELIEEVLNAQKCFEERKERLREALKKAVGEHIDSVFDNRPMPEALRLAESLESIVFGQETAKGIGSGSYCRIKNYVLNTYNPGDYFSTADVAKGVGFHRDTVRRALRRMRNVKYVDSERRWLLRVELDSKAIFSAARNLIRKQGYATAREITSMLGYGNVEVFHVGRIISQAHEEQGWDRKLTKEGYAYFPKGKNPIITPRGKVLRAIGRRQRVYVHDVAEQTGLTPLSVTRVLSNDDRFKRGRSSEGVYYQRK